MNQAAHSTASELVLAAPDWHSLDTLARRMEPPALWAVGGQSLIAHWLDHAVRLGCQRVILYCPDRPAAVRTALEEGAYWSLNIDLRPTLPPADAIVEIIDHLPGHPGVPRPVDGGSLLQWWLALNATWLNSRDPSQVHLDSPREKGGWIGPRVMLPAKITLKPPYWIGAGTLVGEGCTIGPGALIGPGCVLSADVTVSDSLVLTGTFVGAHLELQNKILSGCTLLDPSKPARVDIADDFIATAMKRTGQATPAGERIAALLLWLPAMLLSLTAGPRRSSDVTLPGGKTISLATGSRGPLLARRAGWLLAVICGHIRLIGILPRDLPPRKLPDETHTLLAQTTPGMFSLSDMHDVHDSNQPDELAHALYQAAMPDADASVRRAFFKLCFKTPHHD